MKELNIDEVVSQYGGGSLSGWTGKEEADKVWERIKHTPNIFSGVHAQLNPVEVGKKMMLYEVVRKVIGKDTENYAQATGDPFRAGTLVLMSDGTEKKVEDIVVGDVVKNHLLEDANVTNTINKKFTGRMITIWVDNFDRSVTATETHHGLVWRGSDDEYGFSYERVKFGELRLDDKVLIPNTGYGHIKRIEQEKVVDEEVYCIVTENHYTAIFNGQAHSQCISFGMKNALEYLQCCEILLNKKEHTFRPISTLYLYYLCRVVNGMSICMIPGASGGNMAEGVVKHGSIYRDESGVPAYSGINATMWGCRLFDLMHRKFLKIGEKNLIGSAAKVNNWEELVTAICNGYPCTVASNQGFEMSADAEGYHRAKGRWPHQMQVCGVGQYKGQDYCIILNSWGDKFGRLKDFDNPEIELPIGVMRVKREDMETSMIKGGEVFALSAWANLPDNNKKLEKELFTPI